MDKAIYSPFRLIVGFFLGLFIALNLTPVVAATTPPKVNWNEGPHIVSLGDNLAQLNLPKGYLFANAEDTSKLMEYMGNIPSKQDIGLVVPNTPNKDWFVVFSYDPLGYVKEDESQSIDSKAILESIKTGTEEENKQRQSKGLPSLVITGWQEVPHYDQASHNLVWALFATENGNPVVNYNTRKLGRGGVTSITLVTSPTELPLLKPEIEKLVANYDYVTGNKYSDFIQGTDKVAEIGLTALIAGGVGAAAVKTGVFAKVLLFFVVALKKIWIFLIIGLGGLFKKLFGGQKPQDNSEEGATDKK
ncbi:MULTISPECIES: DUF2167 domain-containing protein [unclassified Microcoleus]|uniref:DUF2167 domain-containing protein n=1 Tax=unclassified Microcoleus TaxID=2642155 RepID=UPI002FCF4A7D